MRYTSKIITALFLLIDLSFVSAQDEYVQFGGYAKYLYSSSKYPELGRINDHILHLRVNSKLFLSEYLSFNAEARNRIYIGDSPEKIPDFSSFMKPNHDLGDMDIFWWENNSSIGHSELDRLNAEINISKFQLTLGRQRIAWGTALVWNPTDIFNPMSILDFDYEERPGVDALRAQYYLSEVSKIELAVKPSDRSENRIIAAKLLQNRWSYDFHFLFGFRGSLPIVSFNWAGDIAGAGFRGEIFSAKISDNYFNELMGVNNKWSTSLSLSFDYTFPNTLYLHTEFLYNNLGLADNYETSQFYITTLKLLTAARYSIYQEVSYEIHPLLRENTFIIFNPSDKSYVFVPSLTWSAFENFDLMLISMIAGGSEKTEYGDYGTSLFARIKYSF